MNKINLLVIDDEAVEVKRQMDELKASDSEDILGEIIFLNSFPDDIETLNFSSYINFEVTGNIDAVLIDYDLNSNYSGTLISAWLFLRNQYIPRIAFTTRNYIGHRDDFDGYIMKSDILDNPTKVLQEIIKIIDMSSVDGWLDKKYIELIDQYSILCKKKLQTRLSQEEEQSLEFLKIALNSMDKHMDASLEKTIDIKFKMANKQNEKLEYLKSSISEIDDQINIILSTLDKNEE